MKRTANRRVGHVRSALAAKIQPLPDLYGTALEFHRTFSTVRGYTAQVTNTQVRIDLEFAEVVVNIKADRLEFWLLDVDGAPLAAKKTVKLQVHGAKYAAEAIYRHAFNIMDRFFVPTLPPAPIPAFKGATS